MTSAQNLNLPLVGKWGNSTKIQKVKKFYSVRDKRKTTLSNTKNADCIWILYKAI